jgi:redox-sensitive bicupin YhaK (pirin superfamily)
MSPTAAARASPSPRIVQGTAHSTVTGSTEGRMLFPSPEFVAWPPFEALADTTALGGNPPVLHPHRREEVVNYPVTGSLVEEDEQGRPTEIPMGTVSHLVTLTERRHDVNPTDGTRARWVSLALYLPADAAEPPRPHRVAPAEAVPGSPPGVRWLRLVGARGPVRSAAGLEMLDITIDRPLAFEVPIEDDRWAVAYVVDGTAQVAGRDLARFGGLLASGLSTMSLRATPTTRLIVATVPRPP